MTRARTRRTLPLGAFALLLAAIALPLLAASATALPTPPSCTVNFDKSTDTARPTSVTASTLTFTGYINVTMGSLSGTRIVQVGVQATPDSWAAAVDPQSFNVTGAAQVNFTSTLVVPAAELSATQGTLVVNASFLAVPGAAGTAVTCFSQANVGVAPYYGLVADTSTPRVEVKTGPLGSQGTLIIRNQGNTRDVFRIALENKAELEILGLLTTMPPPVPLEPNQETNIQFTINATGNMESGDYDLFISVRSEKDQAMSREVTVKAVVSNFTLIPTDDPTSLVLGAVGLIGLVTVGVGLRRVKKKRAAAARRAAAKAQLSKIMRARKAEAPPSAPPPVQAAPRRVTAIPSGTRREGAAEPPSE